MSKNKWIKKDSKYRTSVVLMSVEGILAMSISFLVFAITISLFNNTFGENRLWVLVGVVATISLLRMINYAIGYTYGQLGGSATSKNIRLFLGDKFKRMPLKKFVSIETGEIISAVTTETTKYETILTHKIGDLVKTIITTILLITSFIIINPILGLYSLGLLILLIPFYLNAFKTVSHEGKKRQKIVNNNVSDIVEYVSGIQTMRGYGLSGSKNKQLATSLKENRDINFLMELKILPMGMICSILAGLSLPLTIITGGVMWNAGRLDIVTFVIAVLLSFFFMLSIAPLFEEIVSIKSIMTSKRFLDKIAYSEEEEKSDKPYEPNSFDIELKNVDFSYIEGEPVLKKITFTAKQGELTAIVGDSGGGKSTILNLISKYYNANDGSIKIGNIDIKQINSEKVLSKIATVFQDVFLFNDTLINNIRCARFDATDEEIEAACKLANCHDFIMEFDDGYQTMAGENGDRLSGGEKQRVAIARALIRNSPLLLLDEETNSLDIKNELLVKDAIVQLMHKNKTVIMIAHKLSSIRHADLIIVMSDGRIVEQGKHDELLKNKSKYYAMWNAEKKLCTI